MRHVPQIGEVVIVRTGRRTVRGVLCAKGHRRSIRLASGRVAVELLAAHSVWREPKLCISGWSGGMLSQWVVTSATDD